MIDHREGNEIDIYSGSSRTNSAAPAYGSAFSIDEHQSFFRQQTPQVGDDGAITTVGDVLVEARSQLLRQLGEKIGRVADAQFLDIDRTIGVHRVRAGLIRGRNIRTSHDHSFDFGSTRLRWWRGILRQGPHIDHKRNSNRDSRCRVNPQSRSFGSADGYIRSFDQKISFYSLRPTYQGK